VLVAVNEADYQSINAVSAARCSLGMDAEIVELKVPLKLVAKMEDGLATGDVYGWKELVKQVLNYKFDALAIATPIDISEETLVKYFTEGGVNPVGGVEAVASKLIANELCCPVAHGPVDYSMGEFREVVDPRKAVEIITDNYIHCILKGLHQAPRVIFNFNYPTNHMGYSKERSLTVADIDVMISPMGCFGRPHKACIEKGIPIIVVRENKSVLNDFEDNDPRFIFVDNYIEAAGRLQCLKAGVHYPTVRRPVEWTKEANRS